ncbi:MAG: RsmB/NOP family class I SAM-dependent RNA methyltransferase [Candidatus Lokiarchaeia archaeon]
MNFIVKKTIKNPNSLKIEKIPQYLYITYRVLWEHASEKRIATELEVIDKEFLKRVRTFSWDKALIHKDEKERLSISAAIPSFMIDHLHPVMSIDFIRRNFKIMNGLQNEIEITVRANKLSIKLSSTDIPQQIKDNFKKNKIGYRKDIDIPELFWIPLSQKKRVIKSSFYQDGNLIFQDKASAAVVQILSPQQEDKVCDMCAAPGIKTSLIAQYMNNEGFILAGEFLTPRTKMMRSLLNYLKVLNVHIINTDSIIFPIRFQNYFDYVLLDAPCTGSGTFLTNPELKWRQNENFLHQNVVLQKKLLESALNLLKPNGILVYSTCSFYPEEGELQILNFIDQLEPLDLPKWFSPSYKIKNKLIKGTGRLFPSVHHTQGFFIGKFKKKG